MQIEPDGSSGKKVTVAACCFMGLAHILYLKQYIKGLLYALLELLFIVAIPFFKATTLIVRKPFLLRGNSIIFRSCGQVHFFRIHFKP